MDTQVSGQQTVVSSAITENNQLVPMRTTDQDLIYYMQSSKLEKENNEKGKKEFFSDSMESQIQATLGVTPMPQGKNLRGVTWNIPRLDLIWRTSPYVKRAVDWISSKLIIKGIDINTTNKKISPEELNETQSGLKDQYRSLKKVFESGLVYGGSAGLIVIKGKTTDSLAKPLIINEVKKGDFMGIRPLARWYMIEPALDKGMVTEVGEHVGIYNADELGKPLFYRVNLSGGLGGFSGLNSSELKNNGIKQQGNQILVHRSWLLLFNPYSLAHIETQVERYWSASIIETASVDMDRHEIIWTATAKSAVKNNLGILSIDGFDGTLANSHSKKVMNEKIEIMKYTTAHGLIAVGGKDKFEFAQSSLAGNEKALQQSMVQVASAFGVPVKVLFPDNDAYDENNYFQSLYGIETMQESEVRPLLNVVIQLLYRNNYGKKLEKFDFEFKPVVTLTPKQKAEVIKIMMEAIHIAYEDEAISLHDYQKMLPDLINNPSHIFNQISEEYMQQVLQGDENASIITSRTKQIEIAKTLNQLQVQNKGLAGVESPESSTARVEKGGNPKEKTKPLKRHLLNKEQGKE